MQGEEWLSEIDNGPDTFRPQFGRILWLKEAVVTPIPDSEEEVLV